MEVKLVQDEGEDLNAEDAEGHTLLTRAILQQDQQLVSRLIACEHVDLDHVRGLDGSTPLFIASQVGNAELVQLLLQASLCCPRVRSKD